ncbi:VPS8 [Candida margitis]|uniref:VPS8 n=1 Tax=Candida margitis TaxID=1775924 RepID=UPI0022273699|nr:VPS8 [Candida margitis]KAI5967271.1 VPS8 [Candida margitis]
MASDHLTFTGYKRRFDDRSTTKTSLALRSYRSSINLRQQRSESPQVSKLFKWSELSEINNMATSLNFESTYGKVIQVKSNAIYIALGTTSGKIVIFNYNQDVQFTLDCPEQGDISYMTFASDSSFFAAGFRDGAIRLWELKSELAKPYFTIYPNSKDGHPMNHNITFVAFVESQTHNLISIDDSGLVIKHNGVRKLRNVYFFSERLFTMEGKIQSSRMLPIGSSHQVTDGMGVLTLMTRDVLSIHSTTSLNDPALSHLTTQYKIGVKNSGNVTALSWFPCVKTLNGVSNAKLAYSWNNVLGILELNNKVFPSNFLQVVNDAKDKDKVVPKLPFIKTTKRNLEGNVSEIKWIQSDVVCVFTGEKMTTFYYDGGSLDIIGEDELRGYQQVSSAKRCFILLDEQKLFLGRQLSWADILLEKISTSNYFEALEIADEYYNTNSEGKLVAVGLPVDKTKRSTLVRPYLIEIMKESLSHLQSIDPAKYLEKYLSIIAYVGYTDILEELLLIVDNDRVYFQTLEPFILSESLLVLPPVVLKRLVEYYASNGDLLTDILCTLDIKSLDIDLTIQLCKKYDLRECLIYIWNYLLGDYETPLLDFIKDFVDPQLAHSENAFKAYTYISFILTSRQYPTDKFIADEEPIQTICDILFSSGPITRNGKLIHALDDDTIFPYLYTFLKQDSFQLLSAMNEFFESSFLNENTRISRQFLVDAFLDLYEANEFSPYDGCQLSIFIARNYPKYPQFIRLAESTLDTVIDRLCSNKDPEIAQDCELALQSLTSQYLPEDDHFVEKLQMGGFYNVLVKLYISEQKYANALESLLLKDVNEEGFMSEFQAIVVDAFTKSKDVNEKINFVRVLKANFAKLVLVDIDTSFASIQRFAPHLHKEILNVSDDAVKYRYLSKLFEAGPNSNQLLYEYIRLCIEFDKSSVIDIVKRFKINGDDNILTLLKENDITDGQAIILSQQHKFEDAVSVIIERLKSEKDMASKDECESYVDLACTICEDPATYKTTADGITVNEKLWLRLITSLVDLANAAAPPTHDFFNGCIQDCFRKISDYKLSSSKDEQSFSTIFTKFLQNYSNDDANVAKLSNIRGILQEVFISYSDFNKAMVVTRSKLHKTSHSHDNGILNNPDDVSSENILGYDDTYAKPHEAKRRKKITFDEDGESIANEELEEIEDQDVLGELEGEDENEDENEEEDSDSDEAPEEESTSSAKEQLIAKQKQEKQRQAELEKQAKQRRKLQDERFKQQQLDKKQKELAKKQNFIDEKNKLPEFLPDDIESIIQKPSAVEVRPKHIRLDDASTGIHLSKKQQIEQRLRELKKSKTNGVKKGPVYVKTQTFGAAIKVVPRGEGKVLKNKQKWLNRKSIIRK